ncbi:MAG: DUF2332 family protein [Candidatus Latescibacteria bacterium]|nr:DUF2332 family protein [Candidatus Latescibacterota bacterium]
MTEQIAARYRHFAELECKGYSELYYRLAHAVADAGALRAFIALMPEVQPNLFFAAVQYLTGPEQMPVDGAQLRNLVEKRGEEVAVLMRARRTQTNEIGRCAVLLPALPPGPLALVEVGASAGLCLLLDHFHYDYGAVQIGVPDSPVRLRCAVRGALDSRLAIPEIAWRCGLDIEPVDLGDEAFARWLLACVWADHPERRQRLEAAIELARHHPPPVRRGDLVDDLEAVLETAPTDATLTVFHSAVLPYVSPERRTAFAGVLADFARHREIVWIANEAPGALAEIKALAPALERPCFLVGRTVLGPGYRDAQLIGLAHPHGADFEPADGSEQADP